MRKERQVYRFQNRKKTQSHSPVPESFWCNHYRNDSKEIIQDGSACCFMHFVGLPKRKGMRHPIYPWQMRFLEKLESPQKKFMILKPPKIGATFLLLYWSLHQAMTNPTWKNGQVAIVVATSGMSEAQKMLERAKSFLQRKDSEGTPILKENRPQYIFSLTNYNTREEFTINTVNFRAFPAANNHIDTIRSQPNMKLIIGDEVAFFSTVDQQKIRDAFDHYSVIGDSKVVLLTTAGFAPQGFAYDIWHEENSTYEKFEVNYDEGLELHQDYGTILYDIEEFEKEKNSKSFKRNYLKIWGFGAGSIFDSETLEEITQEYSLTEDISQYENGLFIDPAYGKVRDKTSSKFGMLAAYKKDGLIYVHDAIELDQSSDEQANDIIRKTIKKYGIRLLGIDAAYPQIANTFAGQINIRRFAFGNVGLAMTDGASDTVSARKARIHPKFKVLLEELRGAVRGDNGQVDKKKTRYDLGDCFNMASYHFAKTRITFPEDDDDSNPFEL